MKTESSTGVGALTTNARFEKGAEAAAEGEELKPIKFRGVNISAVVLTGTYSIQYFTRIDN